jgi:hypothetical protein
MNTPYDRITLDLRRSQVESLYYLTLRAYFETRARHAEAVLQGDTQGEAVVASTMDSQVALIHALRDAAGLKPLDSEAVFTRGAKPAMDFEEFERKWRRK